MSFRRIRPAKNASSLFECFSLCLSRACLGKVIVLSTKWPSFAGLQVRYEHASRGNSSSGLLIGLYSCMDSDSDSDCCLLPMARGCCSSGRRRLCGWVVAAAVACCGGPGLPAAAGQAAEADWLKGTTWRWNNWRACPAGSRWLMPRDWLAG